MSRLGSKLCTHLIKVRRRVNIVLKVTQQICSSEKEKRLAENWRIGDQRCRRFDKERSGPIARTMPSFRGITSVGEAAKPMSDLADVRKISH